MSTAQATIPQTVTIPALPAQGDITAAKDAVEFAAVLRIEDQATYELATSELRAIKAQAKKLDEARKSMTGPLDLAKKNIMDFFRAPLEYLDKAERQIKAEMGRYVDAQERIRQQQEAEARRQREAAEAEARRQREAAEREAARQRAEAEAEARRVEEESRQQAESLIEAGKIEEAEQVLEAAQVKVEEVVEAGHDAAMMTVAVAAQMEVVAAVAPVNEAPKAAGISARKNWKAEVTDLMEVVQAVAAGIAPLSLLTADTKVIGQMAKALGEEFKVPGIRVYPETVIASRAA